MKIKTKRGARRIRNQRVIDRRFVVTDYDGCSYITAGKLYHITHSDYWNMLVILDDLGDELCFIHGHSSPHLDCVGTWYHPIR